MMSNTFHRAGPLDANHGPCNRGPTIGTAAGAVDPFHGLQIRGRSDHALILQAGGR